ncbi:MAG: hypothetical protein H8D93_01015 [Verrucomicrobia bacterium]|nr:hypothetical protein [Verrucomicrobiota bacterium]
MVINFSFSQSILFFIFGSLQFAATDGEVELLGWPVPNLMFLIGGCTAFAFAILFAGISFVGNLDRPIRNWLEAKPSSLKQFFQQYFLWAINALVYASTWISIVGSAPGTDISILEFVFGGVGLILLFLHLFLSIAKLNKSTDSKCQSLS